MSASKQTPFEGVPILGWFVRLFQKLKLPGFEGLSVYDLVELYFSGIVKGALSTRASAIAFSLFMALFPLLIFLVNLIPFVTPHISLPGNEPFDKVMLFYLETFLPTATGDYFSSIFEEINNRPRAGLLSTAFGLSLFLIANGVNAIFAGFEYSHHVELTRNFIRQYLYAFWVGLVLAILLIITAVVFVYFEFYVVSYLSELASKTTGSSLDKGDELGIEIGKVIFLFIVTYLATAILYYFGTKEGRQAKFFSIGALMTTLLVMLTSYLFGIYVEKFARYNELYGALGGLLILMVYIWLNSNILLLGFELNASLNRLRAKSKNSYQ